MKVLKQIINNYKEAMADYGDARTVVARGTENFHKVFNHSNDDMIAAKYNGIKLVQK